MTVAASLLLLAAAGCSTGPQAAGGGAAETRSASASGPQQSAAGSGRGSRAAGGAEGAGGGSTAPGAGPGERPGVSCVTDSASDREGQGRQPRYAEIVAACVRQISGGARLEVTAAGSLPQRMPDRDTNTVIGFDLADPAGNQVSVYATGDAGGWSVYRGDGHSRQRLSGRLTIDGRTMRLTVRSAELPRSPRLDWKAETSWTRSTLTSTAYAFDAAPNHRHATFRASGG